MMVFTASNQSELCWPLWPQVIKGRKKLRGQNKMSTLWDINLTIYHTEQELVQGLRSGEPLSCTCLFKQFEPRLAHLALKLARDGIEADDIVQESFIRACASITKFQAHSTLGTWLHRIVLNTALMQQRRKQLPLLPLEDISDEQHAQLFASPVRAGGDPLEIVLLKEQRTRLQQAIRALPEVLQNVVLLRAIEGVSTKEAAALLGISETALKVRFHRARLTLQNSLASEIQENVSRRKEEGPNQVSHYPRLLLYR